MNIRQFGAAERPAMVLIHPSLVTWDYFRDVIPFLESDYRLFVPALPGFDPASEEGFVSVERCAAEIVDALLGAGVTRVDAVYGCSLGGSVALRMAVDGRVDIRHLVMDGGITPYQLPRAITRLIALRDFCLMALGKLGGERLMARAFSGSQYTDEDMKYLANIMRHCTWRTLWNAFDSCNNYAVPEGPLPFDGVLHYWYAQKERKARDWDIRYMKKRFPDTVFREFEGLDHGDMALFRPQKLADELRKLR